MTCETISAMLKDYRVYKARCAHIAVEREDLERRLKRLEENASDLALRAYRLDGLPSGGGRGDPCGQLAVRLADGELGEEARMLTGRLQALEREYRAKGAAMRYVDAWLMGLTQRERLIVERQLIEGALWRDVARRFQEAFAEDYSIDSLKRIRAKAIQKIVEITEIAN